MVMENQGKGKSPAQSEASVVVQLNYDFWGSTTTRSNSKSPESGTYSIFKQRLIQSQEIQSSLHSRKM
jgi:hypothetical protein